jgi:uncharacterized LabA/DUF88 family protein
VFNKSEKIAVLIDGPFLNSVGSILNVRFDFRSLRLAFAQRGRITTLKYYTCVDFQQEMNSLFKLLDWLDYNGYRVFKKPCRTTIGSDGQRVYHGSVSAEVATDMILLASKVDHIVLFGNNHDYVYPISEAKRLGVRVSLASTSEPSGFKLKDELRRVADDTLDISEFQLEFDHSKRILIAAE